MTIAVIDLDWLIYSAGFACEKRSVQVKSKASGNILTFKNQTEFWGRKKTEIEGWLGERNKEQIEKGRKVFSREDFEIETVRVPESVDHALHTVKVMLNRVIEAVGADEYIGYIGKGDSWRVERSTIFKYKGDREFSLKPLLKDEITKYLIKHHNGIVVEGLEADDWVNIEAIRSEDSVVIAEDKDSRGCPVKVFNPNKPEEGIIDCNCFGEIFLVEKGSKGKEYKEVTGYGRKFFYYQVAYGDDIDCYRANSASEKDWGPVSAFNALNSAQNDREALQALKNIYLTLYPSPKVITGWRGNEIEIDWIYVLDENWDLARMWRHENDVVSVKDVLKKYGLLED